MVVQYTNIKQLSHDFHSVITRLALGSQGVLLRLIPRHELLDAIMKRPMRLVATFSFKFCRIGICLIDIAGLHRQEHLFGFATIGLLDF